MSSTLLSPLRVGTLELENRMAVAPMVTWFSGDNDAGIRMYDEESGAAYDGLTPNRKEPKTEVQGQRARRSAHAARHQ